MAYEYGDGRLITIQVPRRFVVDPWGGTETVVLETSKRLAKDGFPTEIYTSIAMSDRATESIEGIKVQRYRHFYPYLGLSSDNKKALDQKAGNLFSFGLWRALMAKPGLQVLHLHTGKRLGGIVRTVAQKRGIPYLVSLHGGLLDVPASEVAGWTDPTKGCFEWGKALGAVVGARRVMDDADGIVCVSEQEAKKVRDQYPSKRVLVLPNGVEPEAANGADGTSWRRELGIPSQAFVFLQVGRIDPQKDQLASVRAFGKVATLFTSARLVLIGGITNTDYAQEVQTEIESSGLGSRITFIPGYSRGDRRLWDAYDGADAVLVPSRHEPFGIVALEAWAAGKPVIASAVGGLLELVESGVNGFLAPVGDSEGISAAMVSCLEDVAKAKALGASGRRKVVQNYSWDSITKRLEELYREVSLAHRVSS